MPRRQPRRPSIGFAAAKRALLAKFDAFQEANPMLGLRGCRLGLVYPELNVMQVRAIASAAAELKRVGLDPRPEIMVPLVGFEAALAIARTCITLSSG